MSTDPTKLANPHGVDAVHFVEVKDYTTFDAEYGEKDGNLIFHFFKTPEVCGRADEEQFWVKLFPQVLDVVAREAFSDPEGQRLVGAYTEELESYFLKARGFASVPDPDGLATAFLEQLDQALDTKSLK
jgi:hypothetical protein